MDRVKRGGYAALIEAAYQAIPEPLHRLIHPAFFCGTDPIFAGLHSYEDASYDRSYRDTAHVAYAFNINGPAERRRVTVVMPELIDLEELLHELGHVLHQSLDFDHIAVPVTWYAEDDQYEAFAEAFISWLVPGYADRPDDATLALFGDLVWPTLVP
jgi:hypothetical protein